MGYHWQAYAPSPYGVFKVQMVLWVFGHPENKNNFKSLYVSGYILKHFEKISHGSYILENLCASNPPWQLEKILSLSLLPSASFQRPSSSPLPASLEFHDGRKKACLQFHFGSFTICLEAKGHIWSENLINWLKGVEKKQWFQ